MIHDIIVFVLFSEQEANFSSAILQQADQKIQSDVLCNALYDYFLEDFNIFDPDTQICAGRDEVGRTPCFGKAFSTVSYISDS